MPILRINDGHSWHNVPIEVGYIILKQTIFSWKQPLAYIGLAIRLFINIPVLFVNLLVLIAHLFDYNQINFIKFCPYNHVGIVYNNPIRGLMSVDAKPRGVVETRIERELKGNVYSIRKPIYASFDPDKCNGRTSIDIGKKYDLVSLFIFQPIKQRWGIWLGKRDKRASDKIYCSEQVARSHKEVFKKPELIDPEDVYRNDNFTELYAGSIKEAILIRD